MKNARMVFCAAIVLLATLVSCSSSTKLTSVWMDTDYRGGYLKSVMVLGVSADRETRQLFEDRFVRRLEDNGVMAFSSAAVIPPGEELNSQYIVAEAKKHGANAILVTHLTGIEEKPVYHPPMAYASAHPYYNRFPGYYRGVYGNVHSPGYYTIHTDVKLETNVYDVKTEDLIWSAASKTFNPDSAKELSRSLSKQVLKNMRLHGLVEPLGE